MSLLQVQKHQQDFSIYTAALPLRPMLSMQQFLLHALCQCCRLQMMVLTSPEHVAATSCWCKSSSGLSAVSIIPSYRKYDGHTCHPQTP